MFLKLEILNSSGVATGDYFYVSSDDVVKVSDNVVNSVPCVEIVSSVAGTNGLKLVGSASDVISACGPANFVTLTAPDPKTIYIRASAITSFAPSSRVSGANGNTFVVFAYANSTGVQESPDDILDAINAVTPVP